MSYTIDDFNKEVAEKYLHLLSIDEILDKIPTDKMLDKLSIDDFFKKFSKEDILTYLKNAEKKH